MCRPVRGANETWARTGGYLLAVLLLPALVLWRQDNTVFTGRGYLDPWFYLGFFRNLADFKHNLFPGTYYGSRLSWLLPGALAHSLFSPVAASYVLHLGVHTVATVSLFLTLKWLAGTRRAFLAAMLFSVNPWLWAATGWDYVDGVAVAYYLLATALLTRSALRGGSRWAMLAAGMALAGVAYANLYWVTLEWMLPAGYIVMMRSWHGAAPLRVFRSLCVWVGAGCAAVTVALGAVNWFLDGHFFFYAPSVLEALQIRGDPLNQFVGPWQHGALAPWLGFAAVAAVAAVTVLASRWRALAHPDNIAPAVFSVQLLGALGWMGVTQALGNPVLGLSYYASDLLPFTFLAIGARFWPSLESVPARLWVAICAVAAVLFGAAWLDRAVLLAGPLPHVALAGIAAAALSLAFRGRAAGLILSLAGFAVLVSQGVGARYAGLDAHSHRRQYEAVMDARAQIETMRRGGAVRFWYDPKDRAATDATALTSTYLWSFSLVAAKFAASAPLEYDPCAVELAPSTLVASISADGRGGDRVAGELSGCLKERSLRLEPAASGVFGRGTDRFAMDVLRVRAVPGAWIAVAPAIDGNRHGALQDAGAGQTREFPDQYWALEPGGDSRAYLRPVPGGLRVRTHATPGSLAARYPVLRATVAGRYRFAMRYWQIGGFIRFGAYRADGGAQWLAYSTQAYWDGSDPNLVFWVDLAAGEEFQLAIENHNGSVRLPATFTMRGVTAARVGGQ